MPSAKIFMPVPAQRSTGVAVLREESSHTQRGAETLPFALGKIVELLPASFVACQFCFITWMISSVVPAAS
jgi:hypothetical protein